MAKDKLTEYSATNASNDVIGDISVAEGMLPSAVNNALREQMTHLKNFSDGTDAIDALAVDNLKLDGNTISSTDTNGDITLDPNGTGNTIIASGATVQTASTSTSAFDFGVQVNNSYASNDSISAIGFHNRADVNATGVGGAIAFNGGGVSGGSGNITFNIKDNSNIANVVDVADEKMRLDSSGNLTLSSGIFQAIGVYNNTTGSGANVVVDSGGGFARSTSSQRYKNTIADATHGLTELLTLRPVTYKHNNSGDTVFGGLIAEEVHAAGLTEFVQYSEDKNGNDQPEALDYANMVSLCIKAIQEQQATITALEARIAALEA